MGWDPRNASARRGGVRPGETHARPVGRSPPAANVTDGTRVSGWARASRAGLPAGAAADARTRATRPTPGQTRRHPRPASTGHGRVRSKAAGTANADAAVYTRLTANGTDVTPGAVPLCEAMSRESAGTECPSAQGPELPWRPHRGALRPRPATAWAHGALQVAAQAADLSTPPSAQGLDDTP